MNVNKQDCRNFIVKKTAKGEVLIVGCSHTGVRKYYIRYQKSYKRCH